jgi:hypothetical protein
MRTWTAVPAGPAASARGPMPLRTTRARAAAASRRRPAGHIARCRGRRCRSVRPPCAPSAGRWSAGGPSRAPRLHRRRVGGGGREAEGAQRVGCHPLDGGGDMAELSVAPPRAAARGQEARGAPTWQRVQRHGSLHGCLVPPPHSQEGPRASGATGTSHTGTRELGKCHHAAGSKVEVGIWRLRSNGAMGIGIGCVIVLAKQGSKNPEPAAGRAAGERGTAVRPARLVSHLQTLPGSAAGQ